MWCRSEYILCVRCVWKKSAKSKWERWAITLTLTHTRTLVTAKRNQWLDSRVLPSILKYSCQRYIRIWRHTETGLTCILMVLEIFFLMLAGFDIPNSIWPRVILSSTCSSLFVFEMFNFIMCIFNFTRSNHRIPQCTHLSVSEGSTDDAQYFDKQITNEYSIYISICCWSCMPCGLWKCTWIWNQRRKGRNYDCLWLNMNNQQFHCMKSIWNVVVDAYGSLHFPSIFSNAEEYFWIANKPNLSKGNEHKNNT